MLVAMATLDEQDEVENILAGKDEPEKKNLPDLESQILRYFGAYSLEYAKFLSAKSRFIHLKAENLEESKEENKQSEGPEERKDTDPKPEIPSKKTEMYEEAKKLEDEAQEIYRNCLGEGDPWMQQSSLHLS